MSLRHVLHGRQLQPVIQGLSTLTDLLQTAVHSHCQTLPQFVQTSRLVSLRVDEESRYGGRRFQSRMRYDVDNCFVAFVTDTRENR